MSSNFVREMEGGEERGRQLERERKRKVRETKEARIRKLGRGYLPSRNKSEL